MEEKHQLYLNGAMLEECFEATSCPLGMFEETIIYECQLKKYQLKDSIEMVKTWAGILLSIDGNKTPEINRSLLDERWVRIVLTEVVEKKEVNYLCPTMIAKIMLSEFSKLLFLPNLTSVIVVSKNHYKTFNYSKICPRWVPRLLTKEMKENILMLVKSLWNVMKLRVKVFLIELVTGDESWIHNHISDSKRCRMASQGFTNTKETKDNSFCWK
ncbi:hypothetical protein LAZ67_1001755, partial [Cordylochernes scorpioides]